ARGLERRGGADAGERHRGAGRGGSLPRPPAGLKEGGMTEQERRARNEALFREGNERIEDAARTAPPGAAQLLCECSDPTCAQAIPLTLAAYEAVRAVPTRFVVAPGHETDGIEHVVERHHEYVVVEKDGAAGEVAEETDPRA